MYGGSPLNRLSWLRSSQTFLNGVAALSSARWILFNAGQPLMVSTEPRTTKPELAYLGTEDVKPFLGSEPFFGQGQTAGELIVEKEGEEHEQHSPTEGARHLGLRVVFLGLHETKIGHNATALPTAELSDPEKAIKKLEGIPYFAIDIQDFEESSERVQDILKQTTIGQQGKVLSWTEPRSLISSVDPVTAGIFAPARSMVDWNQRNKVSFSLSLLHSNAYKNQFCAGCGSPNYSMWGGWKIACRTLLPWADNSNRKPCPTVYVPSLHMYNLGN